MSGLATRLRLIACLGILTGVSAIAAPVSTESDGTFALGLPACPDSDADGFQDCAPGSMCSPTGACGDCDDRDPAVSPAAIEACDGIDNNCDGIIDDGFSDADADTRADCVDCDPFDISTWELPGLTGSLRLDGPTDLFWSHVPQGTIAHLYRGKREPGEAFAYNHVCLRSSLPSGASTDEDIPASGGMHYYLIEGANTCGGGGFAPATGGGARPNDAPCEYVPRDSDVDGIDNIDDNCPLNANFDQQDTDLDGVGDACDSCLAVYNPPQQSACSDNGVCVAAEDIGQTRCQCDPGYTGDTCDQLLPSVATDFVDLPEPDGWLADPGSGLRYRRATLTERLRFHWFPGTYLVEAPGVADAVGRGVGPVQLLLPTADDTTRTVALELVHEDTDGGQTIEVLGEGTVAQVAVAQPTFYDYLSRVPAGSVPSELLYLGASENGGSVFHGNAGPYQVEGYTPVRVLDLDPDVALPAGFNPATVVPMTLLQPSGPVASAWNSCSNQGFCGAYCTNMGIDTACSVDDSANPCCQPWNPDGGTTSDDCHDNFDNDFDGQIDIDGDGVTGAPFDNSCFHSDYCTGGGFPPHEHAYESGKQFMLLGDVNLCTFLVNVQGKDWKAEFRDRALDIVYGGFEQPSGYGAYDAMAALSTPMILRWVALKCWILEDLDQARECKNGSLSDCGPLQGANAYPYAGAGNNATNYLTDATDYMDEPPRLDLAHSVDVGLKHPVNFAQVLMATDQGEALTGALSPNVGGLNIGVFSVVKWSDTFATEHWSYSVHEMGHSFGLTHCDAATSPVDNQCTVMGDSANTGGGGCLLSTICDAPSGKSRFSFGSAQQLYNAVRNGAAFPYHFGNIPP